MRKKKLTSTVGADIGLRAETIFSGWFTERIAWTIVIDCAAQQGRALDSGIWIRLCSIRTLTLKGAGSVDADGTSPTNAWSVAFINICKMKSTQLKLCHHIVFNVINTVTTDGRIAGESWWTGATETSRCVGTDGALSTATLLGEDSLCQIAFVDILAAGCDVSRVISPSVIADAEGLVPLRFASRMGAAFNAVARSCKNK